MTVSPTATSARAGRRESAPAETTDAHAPSGMADVLAGAGRGAGRGGGGSIGAAGNVGPSPAQALAPVRCGVVGAVGRTGGRGSPPWSETHWGSPASAMARAELPQSSSPVTMSLGSPQGKALSYTLGVRKERHCLIHAKAEKAEGKGSVLPPLLQPGDQLCPLQLLHRSPAEQARLPLPGRPHPVLAVLLRPDVFPAHLLPPIPALPVNLLAPPLHPH